MKTFNSIQPSNERTVNYHAEEGQEEGQVTLTSPGHRAPVAGELKGGTQ